MKLGPVLPACATAIVCQAVQLSAMLIALRSEVDPSVRDGRAAQNLAAVGRIQLPEQLRLLSPILQAID